jgi:gliding motility-associated-like protein
MCAQQQIAATNTGSPGGASIFCQGNTLDNPIWYQFTTNSQGGPVTLSIDGIECAAIPDLGNELIAVIYGGDDCSSLMQVANCASGPSQIELTTSALAPNTQYWVLIGGELGAAGGAQCDFSVELTGPGADVVGVTVTATNDTVIGVAEEIQLEVDGGTGHTWSPTAGLSNPNIHNPIATPAESITYTVTYQVGPCTYTDQVYIQVIERILTPNTFSPNSDGWNDTWEIIGIEDYPGAEIQIFDRWGQKVYNSTGYREPWDGTVNGNRLPDATYYFHIQLNQLEGRSPPYTGFISIVR